MAATKNTEKEVREPLIHITKRDEMPWWQSWLVRITAVFLALIVAGVVTIMLTGQNPLEVYATMFKGAFGTVRRIWQLMQNVALLLCIALAVTPAFKMRFWNIGAEGQVLIGGLAAAACMITLGNKLPGWLLMTVMVICAIAAGAVWGIIPAVCKANWSTNETLFTLMMNYVAMQLIQYFIVKWEVPKGSGKIGIINQSGHEGWFPSLFGQDYTINILIVIAILIIMYIYLNFSKHGYELSVVGESENTARYVGINVKKTIIRTMAAFRRNMRNCRSYPCSRYKPHNCNYYCRRTGLYRNYGFLACKIQSYLYDTHVISSCIFRPRSKRNCNSLSS